MGSTLSLSSKPYFSIIIATYNAEKFLDRALTSILTQTYPHVEILIQDGGSTDTTISIVRKHIKKIHYFASEKDKGVYDAWNKALPHTRGDWTLFLGADDFLTTPETLARCAGHLKQLSDQVIYAYGSLAQLLGNRITLYMNRSIHEVLTLFTSNMGLPFPATFIRSDFLKQHGFDMSYKIAGDFALAAKTITLNNVYRIPEHISYMEVGGLSSNPAMQKQLLQERKRVLKKIILPRAHEILTYCIESIEMTDTLVL